MVAASSRPGGWCLDPFAGSGTLGAVCRQLGRRFVMVDVNPVAIEVMRERLGAPASLGRRSSLLDRRAARALGCAGMPHQRDEGTAVQSRTMDEADRLQCPRTKPSRCW